MLKRDQQIDRYVGESLRHSPKLELNPLVVRPSAGSFGFGAYAPQALKKGISVNEYANQKAPKLPKTTQGKVLPTIHYN